MNILFSNASRVWGGNEKWTLRAAEALSERGHRVMVVIRDPDVWVNHLRSERVEWKVLSFRNDADVRTVRALRKLLKARDVDVFVPTRSRDYWLGGFANWGLRSKYVMRMGITRTLPNTIKERMRYGRFPDGIVVNAQAVKESLIQHPWVDPKKIRVIYNGVDTRDEGGHAGPPLRGQDEFLVMGAGRIESDKGFDVLVDALAIAIRHEPSIRGIIFGLGDMIPKLEQQIREHNLEGRVRMGGFTAALGGMLRQADLAVSSSYREGISNFILESWSAGCPVIATAIEGSAEIVTDGVRGRLTPPGDAQLMAEAILEAFRHPDLRERWIAEGRKAIETTFNWNRMADELERFFGELVS